MPSFDFVKIIVTIFVFVFFLAIILIHVIKMQGGKEGFADEVIDYPTQNAQNISKMIDTVNSQMDKIRTLKKPIPATYDKIIYMASLESDMLIYGNLLNIINNGVVKVNQDLVNLGKIGNPSLINLINELTDIKSKIPEFIKICNTPVEPFATAPAKPAAPTTAPAKPAAPTTTTTAAPTTAVPTTTTTAPAVPTTAATNSPNLIVCLQKKESEYIDRLMKIVDYHNEIIQKILDANTPTPE